MARRFLFLVAVFALPAFAQRATQFRMSEAFVRSWAHQPVAEMRVMLACAGPVHQAKDDCELHVGAKLMDALVSDFPGVVLEPPNVCEDPQGHWRTTINELQGQECTGTGFIRVWPEHLKTGSGCSNPNHFLEVHPMTRLVCGSTTHDFTAMVYAGAALGYRTPTTVHAMEGLKLWVYRDGDTLDFDYCFGNPCKRGQASNFARLKVNVLRNTIRPEPGKTLPGFASAIARVAAVNAQGSEESQYQLLKLYAIDGTDFYTTLLAERDETGTVPKWDIIGIFTIDPFSILRTIEQSTFASKTWTSVNYPVSLIVFGERQ